MSITISIKKSMACRGTYYYSLRIHATLYLMFKNNILFLIKYWLPVILWMGVIFYFSGQPDLSSGLPHFYDWILRKAAHITEYFILTVLLLRALKRNFNLKKALLWSTIIALIYAFSDEYHQTFIEGRFGDIKDVGIDSIGIILAIWFNSKSFLKKFI